MRGSPCSQAVTGPGHRGGGREGRPGKEEARQLAEGPPSWRRSGLAHQAGDSAWADGLSGRPAGAVARGGAAPPTRRGTQPQGPGPVVQASGTWRPSPRCHQAGR